MKDLLKLVKNKPSLFEQSEKNIWDDDYVSKSMLKAHLKKDLNSATREIEFVKSSVKWISETFPPERYTSLLDLGCGPGIYTELFYDHGYDVSGIDLSGRSIAYARNTACENKKNIHYFKGDYTKFDFYSQYNLITLIYCDLGVLPHASRKKLLSKIYASLLPNGVFLFDIFTPLKYRDMKESKDWDICENGFWSEKLSLTLHSFYRYDEDQTFLNQYAVVTENDISLYNVWEHTFTLEEIKSELMDAGFSSITVYGDIAGSLYEDGRQTICIAAQK
ncbi:class I SAM-dependent methyltransferase [Anaerostipes sp.]|uniref:class I SAM-dependent methyltransferase n=1 Tax=Anaerostipes sp. TaxID=1872530 RepID=UPI0025C07783|nr:class I SAM-dependent methyltransferase [Anaerostipes sp.]MBS7009078.1 class I SAM-dependent methyltransferase [Anaerostipes sp.]